MVNLLGDLWESGTPNWVEALRTPAVMLHLYAKDEARPGRKMGHLTAIGRDPDEARQRALAARRAL
jgi:5-(carboxyamino)imidazole ribonucleotide synthase